MDLLYEKINKWIPSKSDDIEYCSKLGILYSIGLGLDFTPVLKDFGTRVQRLEYDFDPSAITSGAMCFFGSLVMSLCQLGYINNIEELFTFTACYILTDHYLDNNIIHIKEKIKTISQIKRFINHTSSTNNYTTDNIDSPIIQAVAEYYIRMVRKIPSAEKHLKEVFQAEVKTMYLQNHKHLDRNTYLEMCEWKGGLFCNAIQSVLELEITPAEYDLGACIQLVDDIMDIEDDIQLGINTIATHDYSTDGNLDKLVVYIVNKIDKLDRKYNIFKIILYFGLALAVHNNRDKYSNEMLGIWDNFIHYGPSTTKQNLIIWLKDTIHNSI